MNILINNAKEFAQRVHHNHFRRDGVTPYFAHLEAVVKNCVEMIGANGWNFEQKQIKNIIAAAYLHDSVEDGKTDLETIKSLFGVYVVTTVEQLTHKKEEDYFHYIIRAAQYKEARLIKIADVLANLADSPTQKQLAKYTEALKLLIK